MCLRDVLKAHRHACAGTDKLFSMIVSGFVLAWSIFSGHPNQRRILTALPPCTNCLKLSNEQD